LFHHALKVANATVADSLMIGDSWENDVVGASSVGMHQVYFSPKTDASSLPFPPTYFITDLRQLLEVL
jgi:putative hydrolase of the HAD superfamily